MNSQLDESYDPSNPSIKRVGSYYVQTKYILGQGEFGRVYEGRNCLTNEKVAVKQIDMKQINKDFYAKQSLKMEIEALQKISHSNVVQLKDQYHVDDYLYLIQEHCKDGELKDYMNTFARLPFEDYERLCIDVARQIAEGMRYVHEAGVIHRDLKPQNILVHNQKIKIIDFGFAKTLSSQDHMIKSAVGSPYYMSPQILSKRPYTYKTDIWSFGMIFYELVFQKLPYFANSEEELLSYIQSSPINYNSLKCTQTTRDVLSRSLVINENDRATWEEVHSILKSFMLNQGQNILQQQQAPQASTQGFSIVSNASFTTTQIQQGRKNNVKRTIFQAPDSMSAIQNMQAELTFVSFLGQLMLETQYFLCEIVIPETFFKCLMSLQQHLNDRSEFASKLIKSTNEAIQQQPSTAIKDMNLITALQLLEEQISEISEFAVDVNYHCAKYRITAVEQTIRALLSNVIIAISKQYKKELLVKFDEYMQRQILTFISYATTFLNQKSMAQNSKEILVKMSAPENTEQFSLQVAQTLSSFAI